LKEHRPTPEGIPPRERALDAKVEELVRHVVAEVNGASPDLRPGLREYALELLREGTEAAETGQARASDPTKTEATGTNPIGIALLLGALALPSFLLFPPVGLVLLAVALVLGIWGVVATLLAR
jgi:VIT1/CCC1 family predicted Fe2+/Mn2+ transporter